MQLKKTLLINLILFIAIFSTENLFSVSGSIKSQRDYNFTLDNIRSLRIMIENFANTELKSNFQKTKELFQKSSEGHYSQEFSYYDKDAKKHRTRFYEVKFEISSLFDKLVNIYLQRTKQILDSTSKDSFDILITYGRQSGLSAYFNKPYNPLKDIKPYKEKEYHFFHDKQTIERYLKNGYRRLQKAKNIYNDSELKFIKDKKEKRSCDFDYLIKRYTKVISTCRLAKQYGIEIHKILKVNELQSIVKRYRQITTDIDPIYDDRIPEQFKVDANDNIKLIHSHELKRLYGGKKKSSGTK